MKLSRTTFHLLAGLACLPASGHAAPILGTELSDFAVLGAASVTNTGATTLAGLLGVSPGSAITGKSGITVNGTNAADGGNPSVHEADPYAALGQAQLTVARTALGFLGPGTLTAVDLGGLTLTPGVYTVPAGVSNLTGALTLDGLGNANAWWVFLMPETLITSAGSIVDVINTGAGAGVYWVVGSSATLGTTTAFQGNILALASVTLATGATIGCGRALAATGAVTMDGNTVSTGCAGTGEEGSDGLGGGLFMPEGGGVPVPLPFLAVDAGPVTPAVPEPAVLLLIGLAFVAGAARHGGPWPTAATLAANRRRR